jgi:hypothetical protein
VGRQIGTYQNLTFAIEHRLPARDRWLPPPTTNESVRADGSRLQE